MELFVDIPLLNTTMMRRSPIPLLVLLPLVNYCMMQECEQTKNDFMICSKQAHKDFIAAVTAGDDGRPDWMARKSCNYLTDAVTQCGDHLVGQCYTMDQVDTMKNNQLSLIISQLETTVTGWDSAKCPATNYDSVPYYAAQRMDRMEMVMMTDSSTTSRLSIVLAVGTLLGWRYLLL